jgi:uncharacterized DUF497 family protein
MDIEFDPRKDAANIAKHGISLARAVLFEWDTATIKEDQRKEYGELRYSAHGFIAGRLHNLVFTPRGSRTRVFSLRKSNAREVREYREETQAR